MAIAGHVSRRMLERYSHVRMEAKRTAMEALAVSTKAAGYDTNADSVNTRPAYVEGDGGPGRVRTDDLFHAMEARSQLRHRPFLTTAGSA
jgi:hypothetical protein